MQLFHRQKGFTLIEILVVIAILTILLAIVLIAVNPQQQLRKANNTQRRADANAILDAVSQYAAQNKGALPTGITSTAKTITSTAGAGNIDLCSDLVPVYIADLPIDPTTGTESPSASVCTDALATYNSGYTIEANASNRITVKAPAAETENGVAVTIAVSR